MSTVESQSKTKAMPFAIRPMTESDIRQSEAIEREAFPNLFPRTAFHRELNNETIMYLVATRVDEISGNGQTDSLVTPTPQADHGRGVVGSLFRSARNVWNNAHLGIDEGQEFIVGFLGTWHMADEAHIVSIGVRRDYRGQGVGELLLIGAIEDAMTRGAEKVTLEVRPSNHPARNLYRKYGFKERGLRKAYYADNREDAIIMTTDPIQVSPYPEFFRRLQWEHQRHWDRALREMEHKGRGTGYRH